MLQPIRAKKRPEQAEQIVSCLENKMENPITSFSDAAKSLSRNPLGIIALFIVLVYGIAALVFGFSGAELEPIQKWPLIWFLVLFPVLVLILFGWLVASHHTKLYSPTDFPDKEGFFRALTPFEQKQRIDEEIQTMTAELQSVDSFKISQGEAKNQISLAIPNLRSKYMVAEELVFRELEAEFKWPANRQVGIFGADLGIDGAIMTRDQFIAVEIKFTQRPNWNRLVQSALSHISKIANHLHRGSRFLLVVISQGLSEEERASASVKNRQLLKNAEQDIELKAYDYDELAKKYGLCEST